MSPIGDTASPETIPSVEAGDLGRQAVRGGIVNMGSQAISVGLQFISTVVLARLLAPEAFGLIGMVMVVVAFASQFKDLGLSTATIQRKELTAAQVNVLFWINAAIGLLLSALVAGAAPLVVKFYGKPELAWVTVALGCNILISALSAQHVALLTRAMRFNRLAVARLGGAFLTFLVSVFGALAGWEHWALVAGVLTGSLFQTVATWWLSGWRPGWPRAAAGSRALVAYGMNITGFELVNYFSRNFDNILIGKVLGERFLGGYTRAYSLVLFPLQNVRAPINSVALPALSRLQESPDQLRHYFRHMVAIVAVLTIPFSVFVSYFPDLLILNLLGDQWKEAIGVARWLGIASCLQSALSLGGMAMIALGMGRENLRVGIVTSITTVTSFVVGIRFGVEGVAMSYALQMYIVLPFLIAYYNKVLPVSIGDLVAPVIRPLGFSLLAGAIALLCFRGLLSSHCGFRELALVGAIYATGAVGLMLLFPAKDFDLRGYLSRFIPFLKRLR